jgi:Tfp pilus assembly protein PilZ
MQTKPEFRGSERFRHEYIIKLEDDLTLSPYYAVSLNLSETGMHFKSLFELHPGSHIKIVINDYDLNRNQIPAKVVWCKKLENTSSFRFAVGVEFLQANNSFGVKTASIPAAPQMKNSGKKEGGILIQMSKHSISKGDAL